MKNITEQNKELFLSNVGSIWLREILVICTIVPMGAMGVVSNLTSLSIFLKKSIRKIALFKYLIILSSVNSVKAFSLMCYFYSMPNLFYDLALSLNGRIFSTVGFNGIFYLFFLGNLIEIMMNIERALYFSEGYQRIKKISPYIISFFILILSLIIYTPNFLSLKMVPEDQIYILYKLQMPTDFVLSKIGKITLIISFILEGPVIFILLIVTNIIAFISYKRFNKRKELIDRANNIEMMAEGEVKKKKENEKTNRKLFMMTSYLSLISAVAEFIKFTVQFYYFIVTTLNTTIVAWLVFVAFFSISLKQFSSIFVYYNYKIFRVKLKALIKKILFF
jgi:hypothetical protein